MNSIRIPNAYQSILEETPLKGEGQIPFDEEARADLVDTLSPALAPYVEKWRELRRKGREEIHRRFYRETYNNERL